MTNVFKGAMKGKTIVISTHYLHLLEQMDRVVLMDKGRIMAMGTYSQIRVKDVFKSFAQVI